MNKFASCWVKRVNPANHVPVQDTQEYFDLATATPSTVEINVSWLD